MNKRLGIVAISALSILLGTSISRRAFAQATTCSSQSQPCAWLENTTSLGGIGIEGTALGVSGNGLSGQASGTNGIGVGGGSVNYVGVAGVGPVYAVWGSAKTGSNGDGVRGTADPAKAGNGVYGDVQGSWTAWAGQFNGDVTARGFYNSSDARLKTDIKDAPVGLAQVLKLRPVTFKWKQGGGPTQIGLIAQEVRTIFPDLIRTDGKTGVLAVNYTELLPVAIKAIQEQHKIIQQQEARIEKLERRNPSVVTSTVLDGVFIGSIPVGLIVAYRRRKNPPSRPET